MLSLLKNAGIAIPLLATYQLAFAQNSSYNANTVPITGSYSTAFGPSVLRVNTGSGNTAAGLYALYNNTSGSSNTANGRSTLYSNTTGGGNTGSGYASLFYNTTGGGNTATGFYSLYSNTTGALNTAHGYQALYTNTSGSYNVADGYQSLYSNDIGTYNVGSGYKPLFSNTSGSRNIAIGYLPLYTNTTGGDNIAIGYQALNNSLSGNGNIAIGVSAMQYNTTGYDNTALGLATLLLNTTGFLNMGVGHGALSLNTTGYYNSAGGYYALYNNSTGAFNTAFGRVALQTNTTGNFNTAFGTAADVATGNLSNATAIGCGAVVDASNKVRIGDNTVTSIGGQVGWTIYSDKRVKQNIKEGVPGLAFISLLKPVMYNYNSAKENELMGAKKDSIERPGKTDIDKINFSGFLAQDVDEAAKKIGYDFSGIDKSGNIMGLRYSDFTVPMVKAIQELQQQVEDLRKQLASNTPVTTEHYDLDDNNAISLEQNIPNPFTRQTSIAYAIPANASNARLVFYDAEGRLMGNYIITARGRG